jgi:UDP-N-acetylglucosamine--N-acetylmuramyl-(pentapeptide) pyrophosphoryl-undecaprenol N-acetylglucosamine transferase
MVQNNKDEVWFIGGHSAGHFHPLKNILEKNLISKEKATFFLPDTPFIRNFTSEFIFGSDKNIAWVYLRYAKPVSLLFFLNSLQIFFYYFFLIFKKKPRAMYSSGGYVSISFSFLAFLFRIPFHLYHFDCIPGSAAKLMSYFASHQYVLCEKTKLHISQKRSLATIVNYPVRYVENQKKSQVDAKIKVAIPLTKKVIFILGGSQGSQQINEYIIYSLKKMSNEFYSKNDAIQKKIYCIHQTGSGDIEKMRSFYQERGIESIVFDYKNDLLDFYCAADLVISRAGAGTLSEINFFEKKSLIIPLQGVANNHQIENAKEFEVKNRHAIVIHSREEFYTDFYNSFFFEKKE